jgi:hypothetical protein
VVEIKVQVEGMNRVCMRIGVGDMVKREDRKLLDREL